MAVKTPFSVVIDKKRTPTGPEALWAYWNPNRIGAKEAPAWFQERLREVDPEGFVDVRWNPLQERWVAFYRKPNFKSQYCNGWMILMKVQHDDGEYMPLDNRLLAALYEASGRKWGSGANYFRAITEKMDRERERRHARNLQDSKDIAMESFDHSQIKVAMRGKSSGSKFSTYHS